MLDRPLTRRLLLWLMGGLLFLPIATWAMVGVGALLGAMGDEGGAVLLYRVGAVCGALWLVALVAAVIVLCIRLLSDPDSRE